MTEKPHIIRVVADEVRRQFYRRGGARPSPPLPRIVEDEIGVEFDDGRFIPYADLGYHEDIGFFQLSETTGVLNEAAPFAATGRLIDYGQALVTTGVSQRLTNEEIRQLLERHVSGDFGENGEFYALDVTDDMLRDEAQPLTLGTANKVSTLTGLNAIVSAYTVREHRVWVITEAGESRTTAFLYAGPARD